MLTCLVFGREYTQITPSLWQGRCLQHWIIFSNYIANICLFYACHPIYTAMPVSEEISLHAPSHTNPSVCYFGKLLLGFHARKSISALVMLYSLYWTKTSVYFAKDAWDHRTPKAVLSTEHITVLIGQLKKLENGKSLHEKRAHANVLTENS